MIKYINLIDFLREIKELNTTPAVVCLDFPLHEGGE